MQEIKYIFPVIGIVFLGVWLVKSYAHLEVGNIQSISTAASKYQHLALLGIGSFGAYSAINWFQSKSEFHFSEVLFGLKESVYPSYGRQIPAWAHALRLIGLAAFIYGLSGAFVIFNNELIFNLKYFFPSALGAIVFFALPLAFQRKAK